MTGFDANSVELASVLNDKKVKADFANEKQEPTGDPSGL